MTEEKDAIQHLEEAYQSSEFKIGKALDEGYNLWKQKPLSLIGIFCLVLIISVLASNLPVVGPLLNSLFIGSCLGLGIYLSIEKIDFNEAFRFENFFDGFQFISKVILLNLIIFALALIIAAPFIFHIGVDALNLMLSGDPEEFPLNSFSSSTWLYVIPIIYCSLLISYAIPMIGSYNLQPWDALRYSAKFINKHWFSFFALYLVLIFLVLLGVIMLIVGAVITGSMMYPIIYASFKEVTQLEEYRNGSVEEEPEYTGATLDDFR